MVCFLGGSGGGGGGWSEGGGKVVVVVVGVRRGVDPRPKGSFWTTM